MADRQVPTAFVVGEHAEVLTVLRLGHRVNDRDGQFGANRWPRVDPTASDDYPVHATREQRLDVTALSLEVASPVTEKNRDTALAQGVLSAKHHWDGEPAEAVGRQ